MIGRLALPEGEGPRPAVLIAHEGNGLDDFQKERAERYAELGYVAFAVEHRLAFEDEMRAASVDWRMNVYGGAKHSFTNPHAGRFGVPALEYHQASDERSWRAMRDLFDEVFG